MSESFYMPFMKDIFVPIREHQMGTLIARRLHKHFQEQHAYYGGANFKFYTNDSAREGTTLQAGSDQEFTSLMLGVIEGLCVAYFNELLPYFQTEGTVTTKRDIAKKQRDVGRTSVAKTVREKLARK